MFQLCFNRDKTKSFQYLEALVYIKWALLDSNQRPPACKAGALNQLS